MGKSRDAAAYGYGYGYGYIRDRVNTEYVPLAREDRS